MSDLPIIIAGGGIGGLAAACGLARKGQRSIVVEQAPQLGEIGAGIQIGPNAFHCFDYLGVGDEARSKAVYIDALRLMDAQTAEDITRIPLDEPFRKFYGNPYAVVHRADLHGVLLKYCEDSPLIDLRTDHKVLGYEQDGSSVTLLLDGRDPIKGRFLIGAEGLRSPIRSQMIGDGEPRISGHTTYRSVIPTEQMPEDLRWNAATLWAGPKCHIVHYPLKGWKVFNLVVTYHRDVREAIAGKPVSKEEVAQGFEHIHPKARQVIEHGDNWKLWVLCDRDPISNWVDGRVALLGDAAHPMLQYFAQGACMAMEDAVALSHCIENFGEDTEDALQRYQEMRKVRTARVQMNSRLIGEYIYHPGDAQAAVRNSVMRSMSADDWYNQLNWLYGSNGLDTGAATSAAAE
ncbi:salicylate hydroxylase [Mameliella alba]|uniref:3-hydroxybenzoate 6-monooxygenase n=1 Tax=Mameliella alba TaxID=561184 RepID=UPI000889F621|nr:3-hydroxybenzoate 6-monooxygenase [Mameliella alba]OWV46591.1 salicylate hydroxylase [Mameliella alba]PTR37419.1 salicylate hydroxylase [Mameliella alba]GGF74676.1 salicylate hydroxylase [Mameliella alba]SDD72357.1 salicylate hydroxylase [Mameliella alba]